MADEGLPPGVIPVAKIPGDKPGSYWVLGSDGGVFALGGASFYGSNGGGAAGSYEGGIADIVASGNGGYIIYDRNGKPTKFDPETPTTTQAPVAAAAPQAPVDVPVAKPSTISGEAVISSALKTYGLEGMGADLLAYLRGDGAGSVEATYLHMRQDPRFKTRFAGMEAREKNGYDPIDEETYVKWEGQTKALFDHYGIPKDFYDTKEEMDAFIAGDVSPDELKGRIVDGYNAVFSSPPETLQALQSMYGIDQGHIAAFFLDPTKGEDIIKRRWTAVQIGTQAQKTGFGALSAAEAEALGTGGMTGKEAQGAFGMLGQATQLTQDFTREEKLGVVGGDEAAKAKLQTEAQKKKSVFEAGGSFAGDKQGISGLGTANK